MGSSELSDALNPYLSQSRSARNTANNYSRPFEPVVQPTQYVPHRSELENAITEPPSLPVSRPRPSPESIHAVQELLRFVGQAQEVERKRRIAWEEEQEAKYSQRQAEVERQMMELRQELNTLRAALLSNDSSHPHGGGPPQMLPTPQYNSPIPMNVPVPVSASSYSPISPISQSSDIPQHLFVQGSSTRPLQHGNSDSVEPDDIHASGQSRYSAELHSTSVTPAPSPMLAPERLSRKGSSSKSSSKSRKRQKVHKVVESSDDSDQSNDSESSESSSGRTLRRRNHHDTRCLTIHHAMRSHIIRLMALESDKNLPDSHSEGLTLEETQPVRFVWDKTVKQSVHNSRMKARVLTDLKNNRRLYKHVPEKDFSKKVMESAFEQCFTTFRQKFKTQRDSKAAENMKNREDQKARKARRLSRRKNKLNGRSEARLKIAAFEHITFDGALQLECMSSEESDVEADHSQQKCIYTRGYPWRSTRLLNFFNALDEEDRMSGAGALLKRGSGKMDRVAGAPKEGFILPPKGVASWMISKRWLFAAQVKHSDLPDILKNVIDDPPGFDWNHFLELGEESEVEGEQGQPRIHQPMDPGLPMQHYATSSSLHYALV